MFCYILKGKLYLPNGTRASDLGSLAEMQRMVGGNAGPGACVVIPEADSPIITLQNVAVEAYIADSSTTLLILPVHNHDTGTDVFVAFDGSSGALPHSRWVVITDAWQTFGGGWSVRQFSTRDKAVNTVTTGGAEMYIPRSKLNL